MSANGEKIRAGAVGIRSEKNPSARPKARMLFIPKSKARRRLRLSMTLLGRNPRIRSRAS